MLVNAVTITAANDTNATNNVATDTLTPQVDAGVTKTDGVATAVPGTTTTSFPTRRSSDLSTATNVAVSDPLPAGVTGATWSGTNGSSGTGALVNTIASLAPGANVANTNT